MKNISMRVSDADYEAMAKVAAHSYMSLAGYIRMRLLTEARELGFDTSAPKPNPAGLVGKPGKPTDSGLVINGRVIPRFPPTVFQPDQMPPLMADVVTMLNTGHSEDEVMCKARDFGPWAPNPAARGVLPLPMACDEETGEPTKKVHLRLFVNSCRQLARECGLKRAEVAAMFDIPVTQMEELFDQYATVTAFRQSPIMPWHTEDDKIRWRRLASDAQYVYLMENAPVRPDPNEPTHPVTTEPTAHPPIPPLSLDELFGETITRGAAPDADLPAQEPPEEPPETPAAGPLGY